MSLRRNQVSVLMVGNDTLEILVFGTGDKILFVQRAREALEKFGIQVDIQDTV